jgi:hypothetical protein
MISARWSAALGLAVALAVSGCGWFGGGEVRQKVVCPGSYIAPDADKVAVLRPGATATKMDDVLYAVRIDSISSKCERADKGLSVRTTLQFSLAANDPGVRAGNFHYFVSIVDGDQNILTKETYSLPFDFDPRRRQITTSDVLTEDLPLLNVTTGGSYAVVAGLEMTKEQLDFNRHGLATNSSDAARAPVSVPAQP